MSVERIDIVITENGSRRVSRDIENIGRSAKKSSDLLGQLRDMLTGLGVGFVVREIFRMADSYNLLQNRLRIVTDTQANLNRVTEEVFDIAARTRVSVELTAEIYSRFAQNTERLGLSQQRLLDIVEAVNQAVKISGAHSIEAQNAIIQFSQGLASGTLRGDELRSVLEQLPALAKEIANGMGVAYEDLRALAKDDKLSPETVLKAIEKQIPDIRRKFAELKPTMADAWQVARDQVFKYIGEVDQAYGVTERMASVVLKISANGETTGDTLGALGAGLTAMFGVRLAGALGTVASRLALVARGAAGGPWGILAAAIATAGAALWNFSDQIVVSQQNQATLRDYLVGSWNLLATEAGKIWSWIGSIIAEAAAWAGPKWDVFVAYMFQIFTYILQMVKDRINGIIGLGVGGALAFIAAWKYLPAGLADIFTRAMNVAIDKVEGGLNTIIDAMKQVPWLGDKIDNVTLSRVKNNYEGAMGEAVAGIKSAFDKGMAIDYVGAAWEKTSDAFVQYKNKFMKTLDAAADDAMLERLWNRPEGDLLPAGPNRAPAIGGDEKSKKKKAGPKIQDEWLDRIKQQYDEIRGPMYEYMKNVAALDALLSKGAITADEYSKQFDKIRVTFLDTQNDLASGLKRGLLKMKQEFNDIAKVTEQAVTNAFTGMEDALVGFVTTGKFNFKDLANSIMADIARIVIRQQIMKPIIDSLSGGSGGSSGGGIFGFIGSALGSLFGGARALGGNVFPGKAYIVGERGPEVFSPSSSGVINPNFNTSSQSGVEIIINNYSNAPVTKEEKLDSRGQRRVEVSIGEMVSGEVYRPGSDMNQSITNNFAVNRAIRRR